jgi:hypothetical protein
LTYHLEVDSRMPADATGIPIPTFIAKLYYRWVMTTYVHKLKAILENQG